MNGPNIGPVDVLNGYGDEEQCFHSHWHLQVKVML